MVPTSKAKPIAYAHSNCLERRSEQLVLISVPKNFEYLFGCNLILSIPFYLVKGIGHGPVNLFHDFLIYPDLVEKYSTSNFT